MTDYFALLGLPRRPWLDDEEVKRKFHDATRTAHPDIQVGRTDTDGSFTELNEAYRVLCDSKLRLQHFLALEEPADSAAGVSISSDLQELFPAISETCRQADILLERQATTTSALSRSLLEGEGLQLQRKIDELLGRLRRIEDQTIAQLRNASCSGEANATCDLKPLRMLCVEITFVTRWLTQLEEKNFQLAAV